MSNVVMIVGESGTGKTTAIRTLNPQETFIILVEKTELPFPGWKKNYIPVTKEGTGNLLRLKSLPPSKVAESILRTLNHINTERKDIKNIIIDDFIYIMANSFMDRAKEKSFDKFTDLALDVHKIANLVKVLRDDLNIAILTHSEESTDTAGVRKQKIKTLGKLLDNNVNLEGMFNIVLFTTVEPSAEGNNYYFTTQANYNTGKSPLGMFESMKIPNDLDLVFKAIEKYNN